MLFFALGASAQNLVKKDITILSDTVKLDSTSISEKLFVIKNSDGTVLDTSLYKIDFSKALLICDKKLVGKTLQIEYRTLAVDFNKKYYHKDYSIVKKASTNNQAVSINSFYNTGNTYKPKDDFFGAGDLNKSGSISRGISVGNNQNTVVNSNLNMQLSGKISDKVSILAAISDNNIPIQPDGSSQQLQEFDKIFISVFDDKNKLTVGDFQITKPEGYFLNVNSKLQGAMFETDIKLKNDKNFKSLISGALSKGKYNRQKITPIEGNQGPYRLRGAENENYIIVLSGTEKVYINGRLLTRGQNNDYIIDYNTGEITFTAKNIITSDMRIYVEFEYSDKNYARFSVFNANSWHSKKTDLYLNVYSQSDSKNQPINQELNQEEKDLLADIGDSLQNAIVYNIDSIGFNKNEVLYKKIDSLGYTIFVYSTNPDSAVYRLGFSYLGKNKGNYVKITSAANGQVYKWVKPENGVPQGDYEPVKVLITPKKRQMISAGGNIKISKNFNTNFEIALSNNDINTFSSKDNANNTGIALKIGSEKRFVQNYDDKYFFTAVNYRFVQNTFKEIERYNTVEFEKDWNITGLRNNTNEHLLNFNAGYNYSNFGNIVYHFNMMQKTNNFSGYKNGISTKWDYKDYKFNFNGSVLNSKSISVNSNFLRYKTQLEKKVKLLTVGINSESEKNLQYNADTLINLPASYNFVQYGAFLHNNDTNKIKYYAEYIYRENYTPVISELVKSENSNNFKMGFDLTANRKNILKTLVTYRSLDVSDTSISINKAENTLMAQINYTLRWFKGFLVSNIFYQTGTGMEEKQAYRYIKVPAGQGIYVWIDRNGNNIQELDEFEVAVYTDQAEYIRVYTPSNEYIKVYSNTISQSINLFPKRLWFNKKGIKGFLARWSNITAYKISSKNTSDNFIENINPFMLAGDTVLISVDNSFRNNLSFNKTAQIWGADFIVNNSENKNLTVNGQESRFITLYGLKIRLNPVNTFTVNYFVNNTLRENKSQYFTNRNFKINQLSNEISFHFQPGVKYRASVIFKNLYQENTTGYEKANNYDLGIEFRYNEINKGNVEFKFNFINIKYNANTNTSISYQMLQGLYPGNNLTWSISYQRNLTNFLQLNLNYSGRASKDIPVVHTGMVQIRAFF